MLIPKEPVWFYGSFILPFLFSRKRLSLLKLTISIVTTRTKAFEISNLKLRSHNLSM